MYESSISTPPRKLGAVPENTETKSEAKLVTAAKIRAEVIVFAIVLLLDFSASAGPLVTLAWLRSILVAIRTSENEKIMPIPVAISALFIETSALYHRKAALRITERELTMLQKITFAKIIDEGRMGKIFALSAPVPSRVILVAQKVFVKIPKTRSTIRVRASS